MPSQKLHCLIAAAVLFVTIALMLGADARGAKGRQVASVTLQSSGEVLDPGVPVSSIFSTADGETLNVVNALTGETEAYGGGPGGSFRALGRVAGPGRGPRGYSAAIDQNSGVAVLDAAGRPTARFNTHPAYSLAFLGNGNIVVASPTDKHSLHVYDAAGRLLKSFGVVKQYDKSNAAQNRFLNRGKVLVDAEDNIYYVHLYLPLIQKFSPDGRLAYEREVEGEAVEIQMEPARTFLNIKTPEQVGGVDIINSATIERETGHLWLALNGASNTGVVYEYGTQGEKLREYSLQISSPPLPARNITGAKDIALTNGRVYVLTSQHQVLGFARRPEASARRGVDNPAAERPRRALITSAVWTLPFGDLASSLWAPLAGGPARPVQGTCGTEQVWDPCSFKCPNAVCTNGTPTATSSNASTQDCKTALFNSLATGYTVISDNCTKFAAGTAMHMRGGCRSDVTICRSGTNSSHNVTLDCPAPVCQSASACPGGCSTFTRAEFQMSHSSPSCPSDVDWCTYPTTGCSALYYNWEDSCCCNQPYTPIVIDVEGDGFALTDNVGGVNFDLNNLGKKERLSWTAAGADEAFLVLDRNGNGTIDNGTELFGNFTPQPASADPNGFAALAEYDQPGNGGDGDGVVSGNDAVFASLRLWQDLNHDGVSEPGELHPLASLGVAWMDLKYKVSKRTDQYGNQFRYRARVGGARGSAVGERAWDVFLLSGTRPTN